MKINLLIITPDQLRADHLGCYGHPFITTKNIDRLALQGVRFSNCYCAAPLCGPSRISFATSTYFSEHNHRNYGSTIDPKVPSIVTSLKSIGYRTGMFGKNHLFSPSKLREVWDEMDEICMGNYDGHPDYKYSFSSFTMAPDHKYNATARLTTETIDFMKKSTQPFLAWVNYQDPHPAYTCPSPYDTLFNPEKIELPENFRKFDQGNEPVRNKIWRIHSKMDLATDDDMRRAIAYYMGQVRYVDDSVGRMLDFLDENGLAENTVVLFFADHGELLGYRGMTHKLPAFYDCLTRIPVILRHPEGKWSNRIFKGLVEEVDLTPTLLSILGIEIPLTMVGKSLFEDLEKKDDRGKENILCEAGGGAPTWREPIPGANLKAPFPPTSFGPGAMVRKGNWKLSIYADDTPELYNIADDPQELKNLYYSYWYKRIRDELTLLLLKRVLAVKVRSTGVNWPREKYPIDVRFEPLE